MPLSVGSHFCNVRSRPCQPDEMSVSVRKLEEAPGGYSVSCVILSWHVVLTILSSTHRLVEADIVDQEVNHIIHVEHQNPIWTGADSLIHHTIGLSTMSWKLLCHLDCVLAIGDG